MTSRMVKTSRIGQSALTISKSVNLIGYDICSTTARVSVNNEGINQSGVSLRYSLVPI